MFLFNSLSDFHSSRHIPCILGQRVNIKQQQKWFAGWQPLNYRGKFRNYKNQTRKIYLSTLTRKPSSFDFSIYFSLKFVFLRQISFLGAILHRIFSKPHTHQARFHNFRVVTYVLCAVCCIPLKRRHGICMSESSSAFYFTFLFRGFLGFGEWRYSIFRIFIMCLFCILDLIMSGLVCIRQDGNSLAWKRGVRDGRKDQESFSKAV